MEWPEARNLFTWRSLRNFSVNISRNTHFHLHGGTKHLTHSSFGNAVKVCREWAWCFLLSARPGNEANKCLLKHHKFEPRDCWRTEDILEIRKPRAFNFVTKSTSTREIKQHFPRLFGPFCSVPLLEILLLHVHPLSTLLDLLSKTILFFYFFIFILGHPASAIEEFMLNKEEFPLGNCQTNGLILSTCELWSGIEIRAISVWCTLKKTNTFCTYKPCICNMFNGIYFQDLHTFFLVKSTC